MARGDGKTFESEIGDACKLFNECHLNSNSDKPMCDRTATWPVRVAGTIVGLSVLLECKEVRGDAFPFKNISKDERQWLSLHQQAGGLSIILIKLVGRRAALAWLWEDWLELEAACGWVNDKVTTGPTPARRKPGTASMPLDERLILHCSTTLHLKKVERPNGLGLTWDLRPLVKMAGFELAL